MKDQKHLDPVLKHIKNRGEPASPCRIVVWAPKTQEVGDKHAESGAIIE